LNKLPLTPDKGRYLVCIQCEEESEYDVTECKTVPDTLGVPKGYLKVNCPHCDTVYAFAKQITAVTMLDAYKLAFMITRMKWTEAEKENDTASDTKGVKEILFDQAKELSEIRQLIEQEDIEYALDKLDEQVEFIDKKYGGNVSESISLDHLEFEDEAGKKDRDKERKDKK
jgi:hypothetical protein